MKSKSETPPRRSYRLGARGEAAEATGREIMSAFSACMQEKWFDEITLEEVAEKAGVNVRTVIRRYGGKDGLLQGFVEFMGAPIEERRRVPAGDVGAAVENILDVYEIWGDSVIRNLAQEPRYPALSVLLNDGRRNHRRITAETFARWLDPLPDLERERALDALVAVTDVYVWKLARRDMRRSRDETLLFLRRLVDAVLAQIADFASKPGADKP